MTFIHVHYALLLVKVDLHLKLMVEFENKTYLGLHKPNIWKVRVWSWNMNLQIQGSLQKIFETPSKYFVPMGWEGGSRPHTTLSILLRLPFDFSPHVKVFAWDKSFSFALQSFWQKPLVLVFVWFSTAAAAFRWIFLTAPLLMKGELLITKAKSCLGFLQENIMRVELRSRSK